MKKWPKIGNGMENEKVRPVDGTYVNFRNIAHGQLYVCPYKTWTALYIYKYIYI